MSYALMRQVVLNDIIYCDCGLVFAVPDYWLTERRRDGKGFRCPNGCSLTFRDPENARLRRRLDAAKARERHLEDQREAAERSAAAYKGQVTRIRKRVGNGVCPCCKRSFAQLQRHMETKHPDYEGDT